MRHSQSDRFYTLETSVFKNHSDFYDLFSVLLKHNKNFYVEELYDLRQFLIFMPNNPNSRNIDKRHMLFGVRKQSENPDTFVSESQFLKAVLIHVK